MGRLLYDCFDQAISLLGCLNQNWGSMQVSHVEKLEKQLSSVQTGWPVGRPVTGRPVRSTGQVDRWVDRFVKDRSTGEL